MALRLAVSKLNITNNDVPQQYNRQSLFNAFNRIQTQLNNISEGRIVATYNAQSTVPTTGIFNVGDFVPNAAISELGAPGSKYVLRGWVCSDSDPLTFLQCRFLTGN
jgi:hypothetical protein